MDSALFSDRSVWTMIHGIVLGGGALMALAAALFSLRVMRSAESPTVTPPQSQARALAWLVVFAAAALWMTILIGTYVSFPSYRAPPPEGLTDLTRYPRALLMARPGTVWLQALAMEIKEHVPWIASMLATAAAFVAVRYRATLLTDRRLNGMVTTMLSLCFVLASLVGVLGIFVNKVAPLE